MKYRDFDFHQTFMKNIRSFFNFILVTSIKQLESLSQDVYAKDLQRAIVHFLRAIISGRGQIDWNYKRQEIKPGITRIWY